MGYLALSCAEEDQEISCRAFQALCNFKRFLLVQQSKRHWGRLELSSCKGPGKVLHRPSTLLCWRKESKCLRG